jgi:thymidylate synthase (FAD)
MGSDLSIVNAARVSFDKVSKVFDDRDKKLVSYLGAEQHTTPFRHNQVSVRCRAPIFLARQLGKHQVGLSWNEVSRRYVDDEPEFFYPESWRSKPEGSIKQGSGSNTVHTLAMDYVDNYGEVHDDNPFVSEVYGALIGEAKQIYNKMLEAGVAPEQARMVLPQSMITEWVWTGSLMAFAHVYNLRIDSHAQVEAQEFAKELDKVIRPLYPVGWEALIVGGQ